MTAFKSTDVRGLARLISQVENGGAAARKVMAQVYEARKGGYCLGITGPPGAGKSTLVDQLIRIFRADGKRVGVLAIDPSSPFTGGAVLGDRVRMQAHTGDSGVYIRSIGSRGAHGGLSRATRDIVRIYDAYGFDWIIVETVGVGQTELSIMEIADTTMVVLVPEAGDTIQTMKAGLLEIADIFVVNKADRDGAEQISQALATMVAMEGSVGMVTTEDHDAMHRTRTTVIVDRDRDSSAEDGWRIPVIQTAATKGTGIEDLCVAIDRHRQWQKGRTADVAELARLRESEFIELCEEEVRHRLTALIGKDPACRKLLDQVRKGATNPYRAAAAVAKKL